MQNGLLDFGIGAVVGGLTMSAGWGLFWLVIGTVGLARRTCSWRVVVNGLTVLLIPLLLGCLLIWARGVVPYGPAFGAGLFVVPLILMGFAWRQAPDGQRVGAHMLGGVRQLLDELLGKQQACGGCSHEHEHGGCA
jgi:hypothetical protein